MTPEGLSARGLSRAANAAVSPIASRIVFAPFANGRR